MKNSTNTSEFKTYKEVWIMNGKEFSVTVHRNSISDDAIRDLAMEIIRVESMNH